MGFETQEALRGSLSWLRSWATGGGGSVDTRAGVNCESEQRQAGKLQCRQGSGSSEEDWEPLDGRLQKGCQIHSNLPLFHH